MTKKEFVQEAKRISEIYQEHAYDLDWFDKDNRIKNLFHKLGDFLYPKYYSPNLLKAYAEQFFDWIYDELTEEDWGLFWDNMISGQYSEKIGNKLLGLDEYKGV